jgi:hypothetical protein
MPGWTKPSRLFGRYWPDNEEGDLLAVALLIVIFQVTGPTPEKQVHHPVSSLQIQ